MPEWLERELTREMAPVEAPEDLWHRVNARGVTVRGTHRPPALLLAAAAMLLLSVGAIWLWGNPVRTPVPRPAASGSCYACHMNL